MVAALLLFLASATAHAVAPADQVPHHRNPEPLVVLPGQAPAYRGQQGRQSDITELLATSEQTGGKLGIFRQTIAPGSGPPTHIHMREVEFLYVLSGDFKLRVAGRDLQVPVGTFMFVPRMIAHTFKNVGSQPGVLLFGVSAGGLENVCRASGRRRRHQHEADEEIPYGGGGTADSVTRRARQPDQASSRAGLESGLDGRIAIVATSATPIIAVTYQK